MKMLFTPEYQAQGYSNNDRGVFTKYVKLVAPELWVEAQGKEITW